MMEMRFHIARHPFGAYEPPQLPALPDCRYHHDEITFLLGEVTDLRAALAESQWISEQAQQLAVAAEGWYAASERDAQGIVWRATEADHYRAQTRRCLDGLAALIGHGVDRGQHEADAGALQADPGMTVDDHTVAWAPADGQSRADDDG